MHLHGNHTHNELHVYVATPPLGSSNNVDMPGYDVTQCSFGLGMRIIRSWSTSRQNASMLHKPTGKFTAFIYLT